MTEKALPCDMHGVEIQHLKVSDKRQWDAIEKLQNRLPVWATVIISLLTFLLGCSVTYAALAVRVAAMQ